MMDLHAEVDLDLAVKLVSIVVHVEELMGTDPDEILAQRLLSHHGVEFDVLAIKSLLTNLDVMRFVDRMTDLGLAPVKRG